LPLLLSLTRSRLSVRLAAAADLRWVVHIHGWNGGSWGSRDLELGRWNSHPRGAGCSMIFFPISSCPKEARLS
jgi:hypothetical protein